jgi:sister-chromatid-cohesion protein PDS5
MMYLSCGEMREPDRQNLYALSELAMIIMRTKASQHQWTLSTYPGKVRLPRDIFHNLSTPADVNQVCPHSYAERS